MPSPDAPNSSFEVILPGGIDAGSVARRALVDHDLGLRQGVMDDLLLLVTELVSNAVRHADGVASRPVELAFRLRDGAIRVEVVDVGTEFETPAAPTKGDGAGGWGLFLVDSIATRWGVSPAPTGTCVWFELAA